MWYEEAKNSKGLFGPAILWDKRAFFNSSHDFKAFG